MTTHQIQFDRRSWIGCLNAEVPALLRIESSAVLPPHGAFR